MTNPELIRALYEAMARKDAAAVAELYHEKAVFTRPLLGRALRASPSAKWPFAPAAGSWSDARRNAR